MNVYKPIGLLLIAFASSGIGFSFSAEMQRHLEELEIMKQIFYFIRSELQYFHAPFDEVFEKVGYKTGGMYGRWLVSTGERLRQKEKRNFSEIWDEMINLELKESYLKEKDLEELKKTGRNLEQFEQIDLYIEQLEYQIKEVREAYKTKKKICQSMGVMGGIFLVILLL